MKVMKNQIVENVLPGSKSVVVCRVVDADLVVAGSKFVRLTDARETRDDAWLIANNRTWAAPMENIRHHDEDCLVCHKDGLVVLGGAL